jgi:hypothetical protein
MLHWVKSCTNFAIVGLNLLKDYEDKSTYAMCIFFLVLGPREEQIIFVEKKYSKISYSDYGVLFLFELLVKLNAFVWKFTQIMITTLMSL